jgi:plastocyanin
MTSRAPLWVGLGFVLAGTFVLLIGALAGMPGPFGPGAHAFAGPGTMMGGWPIRDAQPGPGWPGFVPGTSASPRVVEIVATPGLRFVPDIVAVKQGETLTFEVTSMGPLAHEFMVGLGADVAADRPGTPEIADLPMMGTRSVTYTFDGPGPYAFACHAPGHYEAGMTGAIAVVP